MIVDMYGKQIRIGDTVKVHTDEKVYEAKVETLHPQSPTVNKPGFWVDIRVGALVTGMMSYILEVI